MKKYTSIFNMIIRSSIYKILAVLVVMSVVEVGVYVYEMNGMLEHYEDAKAVMEDKQGYEAEQLVMESEDAYGGTDVQELIVTIEDMFTISHTSKIFGGAFVLISILLCLTGCNFGSRQDYTWQRLQVKEKTVFLIQMLYNCLIMILFLSVQIIVAYGLCNYYTSVVTEGVTNQSIFLAFYRSDFLHSILPMEAGVKWVKNILLILGLGCAAAMFPYKQRRRKISVHMIVMVGITLVFFKSELGGYDTDIILIGWAMCMIGICFWQLLRNKEGFHEG